MGRHGGEKPNGDRSEEDSASHHMGRHGGDKPNGDRSEEDSASHHIGRGRAEDQGHRGHQLPLWLHRGRQRLKDDLRWIILGLQLLTRMSSSDKSIFQTAFTMTLVAVAFCQTMLTISAVDSYYNL